MSIACTLYPQTFQKWLRQPQTPPRHLLDTHRTPQGSWDWEGSKFVWPPIRYKQAIPPKAEFSRGKQTIPVGLKYLCKVTEYTFSIYSNKILIAVSFWKDYINVVLKRCPYSWVRFCQTKSVLKSVLSWAKTILFSHTSDQVSPSKLIVNLFSLNFWSGVPGITLVLAAGTLNLQVFASFSDWGLRVLSIF